MIKAIIFDFDGTLSNRQKSAYDVFDSILRKYFPDFDDMEYEAVLQDLLTDDCNGTINCHFRLAPFIAKYKEHLPDNFEEEFVNDYYEHMGEFTSLKNETEAVLKQLHSKYKLAVLSNGKTKSQRSKLDHCLPKQYFEEVIVSGEIGIHKPDKALFELMANKLGVPCEECLFVGDVFSTDILGAMNAHMTPVWILEDTERPYKYYQGYRIRKLDELFNILEIENKK